MGSYTQLVITQFACNIECRFSTKDMTQKPEILIYIGHKVGSSRALKFNVYFFDRKYIGCKLKLGSS